MPLYNKEGSCEKVAKGLLTIELETIEIIRIINFYFYYFFVFHGILRTTWLETLVDYLICKQNSEKLRIKVSKE